MAHFARADWYEGNLSTDVQPEPNFPSGEVQSQFCLALAKQFRTANGNPNSYWLADRHYWTSQNCERSGGYVCKSKRPGNKPNIYRWLVTLVSN